MSVFVLLRTSPKKSQVFRSFSWAEPSRVRTVNHAGSRNHWSSLLPTPASAVHLGHLRLDNGGGRFSGNQPTCPPLFNHVPSNVAKFLECSWTSLKFSVMMYRESHFRDFTQYVSGVIVFDNNVNLSSKSFCHHAFACRAISETADHNHTRDILPAMSRTFLFSVTKT